MGLRSESVKKVSRVMLDKVSQVLRVKQKEGIEIGKI